VYGWSTSAQRGKLFALVTAFAGFRRDMGHELMSMLGCAHRACKEDELVGLEQLYQDQFLDTVCRSSEWELDDEFLADCYNFAYFS